MEKLNLLKHNAETAYNVGYAAKLHFASFEIIDRVPRLISLVSMIFGIYALVCDGLSTKFISATLLVLGIIGLYVSLRDSDKNEYESKGIKLTGLFNDLKHLAGNIKQMEGDLSEHHTALVDIEQRYNNSCASSHVLFATWFAHYKFFWEQQIDWVAEHRNFSFVRDKVPLTFWLTLALVLMYILTNHVAWNLFLG